VRTKLGWRRKKPPRLPPQRRLGLPFYLSRGYMEIVKKIRVIGRRGALVPVGKGYKSLKSIRD
jgi:hypothetical protein